MMLSARTHTIWCLQGVLYADNYVVDVGDGGHIHVCGRINRI